jgi:hypothetical protein
LRLDIADKTVWKSLGTVRLTAQAESRNNGTGSVNRIDEIGIKYTEEGGLIVGKTVVADAAISAKCTFLGTSTSTPLAALPRTRRIHST